MGRQGGKVAALYFDEEWDLDTPARRRTHARRFVTVDVGVREPSQRLVFDLPASQRMAALKRIRQSRMKALASALRRLDSIEVVPTSHGLRCKLRVADLDRLRKVPGMSYVWIRRVEGLKRVAAKPGDEWYAVRGRVMIQIEGQRKGLQKFEDRIVLVRARTYEEAERRAMREFKAYAQNVYLNSRGRKIRWQLEKIVDMYETDLKDLDPKGTEVWSSLHSRRIRREFEWHPDR